MVPTCDWSMDIIKASDWLINTDRDVSHAALLQPPPELLHLPPVRGDDPDVVLVHLEVQQLLDVVNHDKQLLGVEETWRDVFSHILIEN